MRAAVVLGLLAVLLGPRPSGAEELVSHMTLRVGKPRLWSPGYACMMIVCDDPSVVRVEDAKTKLRLLGLRVGSTRCGFWRDQTYRRVITFDVKK